MTGPIWQANWVYGGESVRQMSKATAVVVSATVEKIESGQPLTTPSAPDVQPIPTQKITFKTIKAIKGDPGPTFELFKNGSQTQWIEEDSPYAIGETYLLFLEKREDGLYLTRSPDGRMKVDAAGGLSVQSEGAVKKELTARAGDDVVAIEAIVKGENK